MDVDSGPALPAFSAAERRLIARLRTPRMVQRYLNRLPYNTEPPPGRATLRSFRGVVRHHTAHCLEAALAAAALLEQHGYPPLVLSFESVDERDKARQVRFLLSRGYSMSVALRVLRGAAAHVADEAD